MIGLALLFLAAPANAPPTVDSLGIARSFLEEMAHNPGKAAESFTDDALVVVGDIGGPFEGFMKEVRPSATWLSTCSVGNLQQQPGPTPEEIKDGAPWLQGGKISIVQGSYDCSPSGSSARVANISVVLRDAKVVMFGLYGNR